MEYQTFLQTVKQTPAPAGTAVLWWLGQMGMWIKMGETVISVDYFASNREDRQIAPPVPADQVEGVDLFLGTHDHLDHIDHEAWQIWGQNLPEAKFIFPAIHREALLKDGIASENLIGLNDGGCVQIGGITVRAIAAAHEFLDRDPATGLYPALQYIIEGNGVRIYHAGDTLRYEGMLGKLLAMGPIDAAILPINGRDAERYNRDCIGNMTFQESVDLAGELGPGLVIPGHWDMFAGNSADPKEFRDYLAAKYGSKVPCCIPEYLQPIVVKR